ncbi:MAG TPA: ion channel [Candidatus Dormibacteraeota bacterium]|nr:ion channel [Candidatus Dormibacteraeota bacterium]
MSVLRLGDSSRWHATIAVLAAAALYALLPPNYTIGPAWIAPMMVLIVLVPLLVMRVRGAEWKLQRAASIVLIAIVNFFNATSVVLLVYYLLAASRHQTGAELLTAGAQIWITNVLVFALWYWELDGGGPYPRSLHASAREIADADFLFPQMAANPGQAACIAADWKPQFVDYLYLAFVTATALSPADVMPLSPMAKMLMLLEGLISLVTLALVLARAVNVLA